jgi:hypothetical protein
MANYAVTHNGLIENTIVADSKEIAEELTGKECLEYTEENPLGIGWTWNESANAWVQPSPFASWVLNLTTKIWEAPVPMPEVEGQGFDWDEETTSWVAIDIEA